VEVTRLLAGIDRGHVPLQGQPPPGPSRAARSRQRTDTLDTYSNLWSDSDDPTRAAVDFVLGRVADSVRTAAPR
jgi:hypothetical protein